MDPVTHRDDGVTAARDRRRNRRRGPGDWLRRNLFRTWVDGVVTVIAPIVIGYVAFRLGRFVFVSGRWEIIQRNLTLFMVGRYPRDELWRIGVGLCAIAAYGGVLAGYVQRMREITGRETVRRCRCAQRLVELAVRIWPLILGVVVLLSLTTTPGPTVLTVLVIVSAVVGRIVGAFSTRRWLLPLVVVGIVGPIVLDLVPQQGGAVGRLGRDDAQPLPRRRRHRLSFPLGVLLALGRRAGRRTDSPVGGVVVAVVLALRCSSCSSAAASTPPT